MKKITSNTIILIMAIILSIDLLIKSFYIDLFLWITGFLLALVLNKKLPQGVFKKIYLIILFLVIIFYIYNYLVLYSFNFVQAKEEFFYSLRYLVYGIPYPLQYLFDILSLLDFVFPILIVTSGIGFIFGSSFLNFNLQNKTGE